MAKLITAETVVPGLLDANARRRLEDDVYDLYRRIFCGFDRTSFVDYVIAPKAEHSWIQLYRGEDGALGGYTSLHIHEREIHGRTIAIVRCMSGTLREHRGANLISGFFADRVLRYRLAHPRRPLYFLGVLIHPSSYSQLVRYLDGVWPREATEMPPDTCALLETLGASFGLRRVDPANPLVHVAGSLTLDSRGDRAHWERSDRPGVQFFLRENPGYEQGHGLLALAPLTLRGITRGLGRYLYARTERRARKLAARARAGIAGLLPAPAE
jgi:hypothetical protein